MRCYGTGVIEEHDMTITYYNHPSTVQVASDGLLFAKKTRNCRLGPLSLMTSLSDGVEAFQFLSRRTITSCTQQVPTGKVSPASLVRFPDEGSRAAKTSPKRNQYDKRPSLLAAKWRLAT